MILICSSVSIIFPLSHACIVLNQEFSIVEYELFFEYIQFIDFWILMCFLFLEITVHFFY